MDTTFKWIGGTTLAVVLLFAGLTLSGGRPSKQLTAEATAASSGNDPTHHSSPVAPAPKAESPFVIKRILPIKGPIKYGEWHWDETRVPDGPLLITVDLEARVLSVFRGGYEIGATAVLLGFNEHPTPLGTYPIMAKERHNISSIYGASMPYTLRLTNDGVSIHSSKVVNGYASHGCIGTPDAFAAKLFSIAKPGDKVIITRGKMVGLGDDLAG